MKSGTKLYDVIAGIPSDAFLKAAESCIDRCIPEWNYKLKPETNKHYVLGLSGGVDSSALAAVMLIKHRDVPFKLLFCDTGDEPDNVGDIITHFSQHFGANVTVAKPSKDLYEAIDENGFLPSGRQRWCTGRLKIQPWEDFMKTLWNNDDETAINFSGLRYDERDRKGILGVERVESEHPFIDQKVERAAVVKLAAELGVLSNVYFHGKSRSGCKTCFFQSKAESCSLYHWNPKAFKKAMSVEKLSDAILKQLDDSQHPIQPNGWYTGYPFSSMILKGKYSTVYTTGIFGDKERVDKDGFNWDFINKTPNKPKTKIKKVADGQTSLFDTLDTSEEDELSLVEEEQYKILYVAVEHVINPLMSSHCGVYEQRIISYSTTQSGLSKTVNGYFYHRSMIADGWYNTKENYNEQSHITVLCIKFPKELIPTVDYNDGSYTWKSDISYAEIGHTLRAISRIANYEYEKQQSLLSGLPKESEYVKMVDNSGIDLGEIIGIGHFTPKQNEDELREFSYDEDAKTVRCIACSL